MTRTKVEALLRREKEKASLTVTCNLRPPYLAEIGAKPYFSGYSVSKVWKPRGNTREHVARFHDFMGPFAYDVDLCLWGYSKSLTGQSYIW